MKLSIRRFLSGLLVSLVCVGNAYGGLITYSSRVSFDLDATGLPVEDFEKGNISAGSAGNFTDPLDSTTNNTYFSPGDILPGLTLQTPFPNDPGFDLILVGAGTVGNPSKAVFATVPSDTLDLLFNAANAVGMDVLISSSDEIVDVSIFGTGNILLNSFAVSATSAGVFFGVISDMGPIERINLSSRSNPSQGTGGWFEGVDNIAFGTIPEPTTLALMGLGLAGIGYRRHRSKKAA